MLSFYIPACNRQLVLCFTILGSMTFMLGRLTWIQCQPELLDGNCSVFQALETSDLFSWEFLSQLLLKKIRWLKII